MKKPTSKELLKTVSIIALAVLFSSCSVSDDSEYWNEICPEHNKTRTEELIFRTICNGY